MGSRPWLAPRPRLVIFLGVRNAKGTFVLSGDVLLCLRDSGVPISATGTSKKDLKAAQAQINAWAKESGLPITHVSRICALSIGENYDVARLKEIMQL